MGSSADLLFRISADSTPAQADLAALRTAVADTCGEAVAAGAAAGSSLDGSLGGMHQGFQRVGSTTRETREALRGLGEEIGVAMPRFVSSWLASLGGVSTVMATAFAPIAVIGLVEVLGKIPDALQKGIDWLHGWTAEAKKAFAETTKDALEFQERTIRLNERLRAIALIGVDGMQKWHLESVINSEDTHAVASKIDELNAKLQKNKEIAGIKTPGFVAEYKTYLQLVDEAKKAGKEAPRPGFGPDENETKHSHEEIEKAKTQVKELELIIKALTAQLDDLTVKSRELPAEAGAAAKEMAAKWQKAIGKETEQLAAAAQRRIIAELKSQREADAETTKQREHLEEEGAKVSERWLLELVEGFRKQREAAAAAAKEIGELQRRLTEASGKSLEEEHRALDEKIDLEIAGLKLEGAALTTAVALEGEIRAAGHAKIDADNAAAYAQELARLDEHLKQIESRDETSQERIRSAYQADVEKYDAAEAEETRNKALNEAQRAEIATRYAAIRGALYAKEQTDLQALANSQGWQGVFGSQFGAMLRSNEALMKEWAQSSNQSAMMVRVTLEGLKETAQHTFESLAQGMGANIAQAAVHSQSIKAAMKAEMESVLENLAAQAITYAIYSTALGFTDLAREDYPGAASAFTAAAIWGSVGAAAAVAGRAVAGPGGAATGAAAGGPGDSGRAAKGADTGAGVGRTAAGQGGPQVTVNILGHVFGPSGMAEVASMLSDAVMNSGATLTATNTTTGVRVTK